MGPGGWYGGSIHITSELVSNLDHSGDGTPVGGAFSRIVISAFETWRSHKVFFRGGVFCLKPSGRRFCKVSQSISIGGPVLAFQMFPQMRDGSEPVQDEGLFESATDLLHCGGHFGIFFCTSQSIIKHADQFANILLARFLFCDGTVEQIQ